jgi:NAD(P)-dependent dehydrogenase (short-subunit alcohol dehydrogenase family)
MSDKKPAVIITGAGTGIGAATARFFSDHGFNVVLSGRRREKLDEVAATLKTKAFVIPADVRRDQEIHWLAGEALKEAGDISVLVNNAGVYKQRAFVDSEDELWQLMYETHLLGSVRLSRYLVPHFKKRGGGAIVNVASTAGLRPVDGLSAYATVKASVISLTQNLALELAKDNIRVNCVCPGIVETPIHKLDEMDKKNRESVIKGWSAMHPLGKPGQPVDVAYAIYSLCAPQAQWMTGVVLPVDGGIALT